MVNISVKEDCGNAPKKELIRDFIIGFTQRDQEVLLSKVSDTVEWIEAGHVMKGKEEVKKILLEMLDESITDMEIISIITHGKDAAAYGTMKFKDGKEYYFCDVYQFTGHDKNALIQSVNSFIKEK